MADSIMYILTPRMLQRFRSDLVKFHELFTGDRCSGWQQEELIVNAIKSDTQAQHHVMWREAGHDDKEDIRVRTNGHSYAIQIKSGKVQGNNLMISGHRLGRFNGDLHAITKYLNANSANIISVSYDKIDDDEGRHHCYHLRYVDVKLLTGISGNNWEKAGTQYRQKNSAGVIFSLRPTMSWQIWWAIPISVTQETAEIVI